MSYKDLASRLEAVEKPEVLRFSVCTVPTRNGYSWGRCITTDEAVARILCDVWNNRKEIAQALTAAALLAREER